MNLGAFAKVFGWVVISVLRQEFQCAISDDEAREAVKALEEAVRAMQESADTDQTMAGDNE